MKSMTGYGRISNRALLSDSELAPSDEIEIAIRSVNGRFLEIRLHAPREYAALESDLKAIVAKSIVRGTVDIYINRSRTSGSASQVCVNTPLARQWLNSYKQLGQDLNLASQPTLEMLARVPEVFHVEERAELSANEKAVVFNLLSEAVAACDKERIREGRAAEIELDSLCSRLEVIVTEMEALKAETNSELQRRYTERLQKLGFEGSVDDQRIAQEIVIQLDRSDVSEEISRLREHLKTYRQLVKHLDSQGKKLDFYAQELLREVNTVGSKSHIVKLTALVVDAKTLVEKIREQVQNVE
jgi:uncharacterized protein (TIGR00255 family)